VPPGEYGVAADAELHLAFDSFPVLQHFLPIRFGLLAKHDCSDNMRQRGVPVLSFMLQSLPQALCMPGHGEKLRKGTFPYGQRPDHCSAFIAVDPATRENGCLQVIEGTHLLGRVDHVLTGEQAGADKERVAAVLERFPLVYVEMDPGDVRFFHSNLLHASAENTSDKPRWSMICCYNAARNNPYKELHHPRYTPLHKVPDSAILEVGLKRFADSTEDVAWLEAKKDQSARSLEDKAAKHS
jgi:Phytanoyl-CoA dioxygenase (PhyH)